jgi:hypothetical protein
MDGDNDNDSDSYSAPFAQIDTYGTPFMNYFCDVASSDALVSAGETYSPFVMLDTPILCSKVLPSPVRYSSPVDHGRSTSVQDKLGPTGAIVVMPHAVARALCGAATIASVIEALDWSVLLSRNPLGQWCESIIDSDSQCLYTSGCP